MCSHNSLLSPCTCIIMHGDKYLRCSGNVTDLDAMADKIGKELEVNQKHFDVFQLDVSGVTSLKEISCKTSLLM